jgi:hypothetical protein
MNLADRPIAKPQFPSLPCLLSVLQPRLLWSAAADLVHYDIIIPSPCSSWPAAQLKLRDYVFFSQEYV